MFNAVLQLSRVLTTLLPVPAGGCAIPFLALHPHFGMPDLRRLLSCNACRYGSQWELSVRPVLPLLHCTHF